MFVTETRSVRLVSCHHRLFYSLLPSASFYRLITMTHIHNPKKIVHLQSVLSTAYQEHQKGLNARAFFKTSNHAMGEDLVQNTFLKTWTYLVHGGEIHIMKAFLYHILNNLIVDEYRKHKPTSLDTLIEKGFDPGDEDTTERLCNTLDGKALVKLIARLPVKYQKIMRMRYIQDLSLNEISLLTGQSKNTIAVQIHRGLSKLKLLYGSTQKVKTFTH